MDRRGVADLIVIAEVDNTPAAWSSRASAPTSHQAAGWSEKGQTLRFIAVLEHLDLRPGETVLDYGCGTGRFSAFLPHDVAYTGYDSAQGMIDRARADHPGEQFDTEIPPVIFDHVAAIGPFNLPSDGDPFAQIEWLWRMCVRRSMVLSLYRGDDTRCVRYEAGDAIAVARRLGAQRFRIDTTHLDNDLIVSFHR